MSNTQAKQESAGAAASAAPGSPASRRSRLSNGTSLGIGMATAPGSNQLQTPTSPTSEPLRGTFASFARAQAGSGLSLGNWVSSLEKSEAMDFITAAAGSALSAVSTAADGSGIRAGMGIASSFRREISPLHVEAMAGAVAGKSGGRRSIDSVLLANTPQTTALQLLTQQADLRQGRVQAGVQLSAELASAPAACGARVAALATRPASDPSASAPAVHGRSSPGAGSSRSSSVSRGSSEAANEGVLARADSPARPARGLSSKQQSLLLGHSASSGSVEFSLANKDSAPGSPLLPGSGSPPGPSAGLQQGGSSQAWARSLPGVAAAHVGALGHQPADGSRGGAPSNVIFLMVDDDNMPSMPTIVQAVSASHTSVGSEALPTLPSQHEVPSSSRDAAAATWGSGSGDIEGQGLFGMPGVAGAPVPFLLEAPADDEQAAHMNQDSENLFVGLIEREHQAVVATARQPASVGVPEAAAAAEISVANLVQQTQLPAPAPAPAGPLPPAADTIGSAGMPPTASASDRRTSVTTASELTFQLTRTSLPETSASQLSDILDGVGPNLVSPAVHAGTVEGEPGFEPRTSRPPALAAAPLQRPPVAVAANVRRSSVASASELQFSLTQNSLPSTPSSTAQLQSLQSMQSGSLSSPVSQGPINMHVLHILPSVAEDPGSPKAPPPAAAAAGSGAAPAPAAAAASQGAGPGRTSAAHSVPVPGAELGTALLASSSAAASAAAAAAARRSSIASASELQFSLTRTSLMSEISSGLASQQQQQPGHSPQTSPSATAAALPPPWAAAAGGEGEGRAGDAADVAHKAACAAAPAGAAGEEGRRAHGSVLQIPHEALPDARRWSVASSMELGFTLTPCALTPETSFTSRQASALMQEGAGSAAAAAQQLLSGAVTPARGPGSEQRGAAVAGAVHPDEIRGRIVQPAPPGDGQGVERAGVGRAAVMLGSEDHIPSLRHGVASIAAAVAVGGVVTEQELQMLSVGVGGDGDTRASRGTPSSVLYLLAEQALEASRFESRSDHGQRQEAAFATDAAAPVLFAGASAAAAGTADAGGAAGPVTAAAAGAADQEGMSTAASLDQQQRLSAFSAADPTSAGSTTAAHCPTAMTSTSSLALPDMVRLDKGPFGSSPQWPLIGDSVAPQDSCPAAPRVQLTGCSCGCNGCSNGRCCKGAACTLGPHPSLSYLPTMSSMMATLTRESVAGMTYGAGHAAVVHPASEPQPTPAPAPMAAPGRGDSPPGLSAADTQPHVHDPGSAADAAPSSQAAAGGGTSSRRASQRAAAGTVLFDQSIEAARQSNSPSIGSKLTVRVSPPASSAATAAGGSNVLVITNSGSVPTSPRAIDLSSVANTKPLANTVMVSELGMSDSPTTTASNMSGHHGKAAAGAVAAGGAGPSSSIARPVSVRSAVTVTSTNSLPGTPFSNALRQWREVLVNGSLHGRHLHKSRSRHEGSDSGRASASARGSPATMATGISATSVSSRHSPVLAAGSERPSQPRSAGVSGVTGIIDEGEGSDPGADHSSHPPHLHHPHHRLLDICGCCLMARASI